MDDKLIKSLKGQLSTHRKLMENGLPEEKKNVSPKPQPKQEIDMSDAEQKKRDAYYRSKGWIK